MTRDEYLELAAKAGESGRLPLGPDDILRLQYTKIWNYQEFDDDLDTWDKFLAVYRGRVAKRGRREHLWAWIRDPSYPWSVKNLMVRSRPCPMLGSPYEPYLSCNGKVLTVATASRILCTNPALLTFWKLRMLDDDKVVKTALHQMLRPGADKPLVEAPTGYAPTFHPE